MSRIVSELNPGIEQRECEAAVALQGLAKFIQDVCYYKDAAGIPPATVKALHRAYRVLKRITEFYFGDNSGLLWNAPDTKFQPKTKGKNA